MATFSNWGEIDGSPTASGTGGKFRGTRIFVGPFDEWESFVTDLWGSYRIVNGQLNFTPPAIFPGVPNTLVTDWSMRPFGTGDPSNRTTPLSTINDDTAQYELAQITAIYEQFNDNTADVQGAPSVPNGTLLTIDGQLGAEYITVPNKKWQWASDNAELTTDDMTPGIQVPTESLNMTWHRVPRPPWDAEKSLRGKVNNKMFLNHAPGTVLFLGSSYRRDFQIVDSGLWQMPYAFSIKEIEGTLNDTGTAQAGGSNTITLKAGASGDNDFYNGMQVETTGGTGADQVRTIIDYDGTTKVATINHVWVTRPDNTTDYKILNKTIGHNYFYRGEDDANGERWQQIEDSSGNPPFASGDFSKLFVFE